MKHIERFRKVVGLAQKLDWLKIDPFRNYQIKFKKVEMGYLEPDELQKIETTKFKLERLEFTKDLFVNGTIFPVISNQKLNSYLKEVADFCNISKNLTFHLARHTFATTVTLSNGVPIETVS